MPEHGDFIDFVLSNVGRGAALNITFRLDGDEADFEGHRVKLRRTLKPINFMLPAESEVYSMGGMPDLTRGAPLKPFKAVIGYEDVDGLPYEEQVSLDLDQFRELAWQGRTSLWRTMEALEKIEGHLGAYVRRRKDKP